MLIEKILDIIFPRRCVFCGDLIDSANVCPECWKNVFWISAPICDICGKPLEYSDTSLCHSCISHKFFFDKSRSVFVYNDITKNAILNFKHREATYMSKTFASWLYRSGKEILEDTHIITSVPMYRTKLFRRMFNQSAILANDLANLCNVYRNNLLLKKIKDTHTQEGLTLEERRKNLIGAFTVNDKCKSIIEGKNITVVDDVLTTGSTINECAKVLKQNGASKVYALTLAKT